MKVFAREIKRHIKSGIILLVALVILLLWCFVEFDAYAGTDSISSIVDAFPKIVRSVLGIADFDLSKISGTIGMMWFYVIITFGCYAAYLGAGVTSRKSELQMELILPISRKKQIFIRILAIITTLIVLIVLLYLATLLILVWKKEDIKFYTFIINYQLFGASIFFLGLGALIGNLKYHFKTTSSISLCTVLFFYIVHLITSLIDNKYLAYLSPISAAVNGRIINGELEIVYFICNVVIGIALIITAVFTNKRKDY